MEWALNPRGHSSHVVQQCSTIDFLSIFISQANTEPVRPAMVVLRVGDRPSAVCLVAGPPPGPQPPRLPRHVTPPLPQPSPPPPSRSPPPPSSFSLPPPPAVCKYAFDRVVRCPNAPAAVVLLRCLKWRGWGFDPRSMLDPRRPKPPGGPNKSHDFSPRRYKIISGTHGTPYFFLDIFFQNAG